MIKQVVDKSNTTLIGQDRETLTFKALFYSNVPAHAQVCRLFCVVYIPLFSLAHLGYPAITNIFVVNEIFRYKGGLRFNEDPVITNIFPGTVTLRYNRVLL